MTSYEQIDQYASELEIDTQVDATNISQKLLSAPNIKHKWLYRSTMTKKKLIQLVEQKEELVNKKMQNSRLPISNVAARKNMEKEPDIFELDKQIRQHEVLVEYLDGAVKQLNQIGFDYKNIVEMMKLEQL